MSWGLLAVVLVVLAFGSFFAGAFADSDVAIVIGLVLILMGAAAGVAQMMADSDACADRGGHEEPDGAPIYVSTGKSGVLVPIQPTKCVVPR